jgi:hypothetical protein
LARVWIARVGGCASAASVVAALFLLQRADAPQSLVYALPAYGAIAIAAFIAAITCRCDSLPSRLCLATTALFFGYVILRTLTSPAPYHARADLYCVVAALVVYGLLLILFTKGRNRVFLLVAIQSVALVHVVVSVVQAGFGENYSLLISSLEDVEPSERGSGLYVNPDHLAGLLEVVGIFGLSITCWSRWPPLE